MVGTFPFGESNAIYVQPVDAQNDNLLETHDGSVTIDSASGSELRGRYGFTLQFPDGGVSDELNGTFVLPNCPGLDPCRLLGC